MGFAERRKMLGYSQEGFAHALGVDRTTVGRWEAGRTMPQPALRSRLAHVLQVSLDELNTLIAQLACDEGPARTPSASDHHGSGDIDDMIRREFLRVIAVTGTLSSLSATDVQTLAEGVQRGASEGFTRMNSHLWQVYRLARSKSSVFPIVQDQLATLTRTLEARSETEAAGALCGAAGDLFQLAGELAFDNSRYTDAAASYTLAASASREARSYDLWACALVRHAYVSMSGKQYKEAAGVLSAAEKIAKRGDGALSTRYWVASVQAESYAGMGQLTACERALDEAEKVVDLAGFTATSGWLRFDGSRLAEGRGARYVQLGRLDLAESALTGALKQDALAEGQSFRRRGAVLTDLAAIGAKRHDPDQVVTFGREALELARASSSAYVARRLRGLRAEFGPLARDGRVAGLGAEIDALSTRQQI
ncbi:helix-turn-helix transcriptional regulator [Streptomyces sp. NPDC050428]|uniref:helix-turn-helix transcriptional regulator n=1 Tax=Streptomyces sp. NPDC050428 TaxID=3155757 RepID=UPI00342D2FFB